MSSPNPRRVLFLVNDDRFFWRHRGPLARKVLETGAEVMVATWPGSLRGKIEAAGLKFHPVRFRRGNLNPLQEWLTFIDVLRAYRNFRPHLVHQITFKPIFYGSIAAGIAGIPAVVNAITGLGYVFAGNGVKRSLLRKIAEWGYRISLKRKKSRVIFQNNDDRTLFIARKLAHPSGANVILGSGVDPDRFRPRPEPKGIITILLASRMIWDKGVGDLIEAGRLLRRQGLEFEIVLAGTPDPANPTSIDEKQLQAWQREGAARWLGYREDISHLIAESHIVCLPTFYREGVPLVLLEAAASARPIVTTDMPGCREIVKDGVNGLLVPIKQPERLASSLKKMMTNTALRAEMGHNGREMVLKHFTTDVVVKQTLAVYEELLHGFSDPNPKEA